MSTDEMMGVPNIEDDTKETKIPLTTDQADKAIKALMEGGYIRQVFGPFKFKDREGRSTYKIENTTEEFMVIKQIIFRKIPREVSKIEVLLVMPDPATVDVVRIKKPVETGPQKEDSQAKAQEP